MEESKLPLLGVSINTKTKSQAKGSNVAVVFGIFAFLFLATISWIFINPVEEKYSKGLLQAYAYEYKLDGCSSASSTKRTECCSDPNYPVLGGVDVVALRTIHGGLPPLLGSLEFAAGLPTSFGTYIFFFASAENRDKFLSDPWFYAPLWGGFDGWEISQNRQLKGDAAKTALGPNADLSQWMTAVSSKKLVMFGNQDNKNQYLGEVAHFENQGNRKWDDWFDPKDGPFNTKCFQGFTYEDAVEAKAGYEDGTFQTGEREGDGLTILQMDDKLRRNGVANGMLYYVNMGHQRIERVLLEEESGRGFAMDIVVDGAPGPKDISLDLETNMLYWTDMSDFTIRRCVADGSFSLGETELILGDQPKPALLVLNPLANRMYYTSMACADCEGEFVIRWSSMDGSMPNDDGNPLIEIENGGQCRGMAIDEDAKYLYWTDYFAGTLNRFELLAPCGSPSELLLEGLTSPAYVDVKDGFIYWVEGSYSGERVRFADLETMVPETLIDGLNIVDGILVDGDVLTWTDKDGLIFTAHLPTLRDQDEKERMYAAKSEPFKTIVEGLDRAKGLALYHWQSAAGLSFGVETKYTERGDEPIYASYPWATGPIVEPYLPTTLRVQDALEGHTYEFVYKGKTYATKAIKITPKTVGSIPVTLREISPEGELSRELRGAVYAKYVRREIRNLLPEDRDAFFQAMEIIVKTDLLEGREKYGQNFKNNEYFVHMHNVLAGARDCDHLHNGKGFLFNHVLLTNEFEEALQLINPALTVPYWDFTIDGHQIYSLHDGDFDYLWNSIIFDKDWYGDAENEHHTVVEGRWAWSLKVADEQWDNQVHNSYGMMRAPWNQNKFPYVQRYRSLAGVPVWNVHEGWPTCEYHHYVIAAHTIWTDFAAHIASEPHGTVHGILGGTFGNEEAYDSLLDIGISEDDVFALKSHSFRSPKSLWRMGLAQCPEYCPIEMPQAECKCTCGEDILEKLDNDDLRNTYARAALTSNGKFGDGYTVDQVKMAIKIVCESGTLVGDQLESASPADPLFWPIHPTVERLLFWKMLKGGFDDTYWPEDGNYMGAVYGGLNSNQQCHGHQPGDILPFTVNMDDGDNSAKRVYTNAIMLTIGDPTSHKFSLPYVYDNYVWDHCLDEGFDFNRISTL